MVRCWLTWRASADLSIFLPDFLVKERQLAPPRDGEPSSSSPATAGAGRALSFLDDVAVAPPEDESGGIIHDARETGKPAGLKRIGVHFQANVRVRCSGE